MSSTKTFAGISMHVQVTIAPSNVPRYHELMRPVFDAVVAEPECTFFEIYHDPANPGVLKWVENWTKDVKWLMEVLSALRSSTHLAEEAKNQVTKPYYKEYFEETTPMWLEPRKVEIFERMPGWCVQKGSNLES